jgi:hypothetical protein
LDYDPIHDILYMADGFLVNNRLYTLNRNTGAATLIGQHGIPCILGLAYDTRNQVLYGTQFACGTGLYRFDVNTGAATFIATMANRCGGLAYDVLRDRLVCVDDGNAAVYIVDRTTGAQTFVLDFGSNNDGGLAYDLAADRFWELDVNGNVYSIAGDGSSAGFVVFTGIRMDGAAALNVFNQIPVVTNVQTSVGVSIDANSAFNLLVTYTDTESNSAVITVDFDEDGNVDATVNAGGPGQVTVPFTYSTPGTYCIRVCVDDGTLGFPACDFDDFSCSKKRGGGGASLSVTVTNSGGGDPYFLGE